jgi:hypothetical protein
MDFEGQELDDLALLLLLDEEDTWLYEDEEMGQLEEDESVADEDECGQLDDEAAVVELLPYPPADTMPAREATKRDEVRIVRISSECVDSIAKD